VSTSRCPFANKSVCASPHLINAYRLNNEPLLLIHTHTHTHPQPNPGKHLLLPYTYTHTHTHTLPGAWREGCSIYPSVHLCFGYQGALLYGQLIQGIRPASPLIQAHRKQKSQMRFLNSVSKCAQICQDPKVFVTTLIRKQTGKERKITK